MGVMGRGRLEWWVVLVVLGWIGKCGGYRLWVDVAVGVNC